MSQDTDSCVVEITADRKKLHQVFTNLFDNASNHSPPEKDILLDITISEDNNEVIVKIVDEGKGIPEEFLPKVFDAFFTGRRGGTGLGLSIVKHIVDIHGGNIQIFNNSPRPGCTAEMRFPITNR
jgi:signal transduction histidine kinase